MDKLTDKFYTRRYYKLPWEGYFNVNGPQGPNEDIGVRDGWPGGVLRPPGESFGWHKPDCSLPMRHGGYCVGGGKGHVIPEGWTIRG